MNSKQLFLREINLLGGPRKAARCISEVLGKPVGYSRVWATMHRNQSIAPDLCMAIEILSDDRVQREQLNPFNIIPRD